MSFRDFRWGGDRSDFNYDIPMDLAHSEPIPKKRPKPKPGMDGPESMDVQEEKPEERQKESVSATARDQNMCKKGTEIPFPAILHV